MGGLSAQEIIDRIEKLPESTILKIGLAYPHSYRGYYDELAFTPVIEDTPILEFINSLKDALNKSYNGYKGGEYTMTEDTTVWLTEYGSSSESTTFSSLFILLLIKD